VDRTSADRAESVLEVELAPPGRPPTVQRAVRDTGRGRIELTDLPPGLYTVRVRDGKLVGEAEEAVELREGRTERARVDMKSAASLRLVVTDADGRPAAALPVTWGPEERRKRDRGRGGGQATTDGAGRLDLFDLAPGSYRLVLGAPGGVSAEVFVRLQHGQDERREVKLPRGADLTVHVQDAAERPAAGVRVLVRTFAEEGEPSEAEAAAGLLTDKDGIAVFRDLPAGIERFVEARSRGGHAASSRVLLHPGASADLSLRLAPPDR
jgi:5-hydroxyisourate hydrolase-like protein (transthyretin family)